MALCGQAAPYLVVPAVPAVRLTQALSVVERVVVEGGRGGGPGPCLGRSTGPWVQVGGMIHVPGRPAGDAARPEAALGRRQRARTWTVRWTVKAEEGDSVAEDSARDGAG